VLVDLVVAIEVGMVLAAFLFMKRMAEVTNVSAVSGELVEEGELYDSDANAVTRRVIPEGIQVYEISGPFFFGAAETFRDTVGVIGTQPKVMILRMRNVNAIDSTAMHALRDLHRRFKAGGTLLLLADVHAQPLVALGRSYLLDEIGETNIFGHLDDALARATQHLGLPAVTRPLDAMPTVKRDT
jgi:SulP family sulfate permease